MYLNILRLCPQVPFRNPCWHLFASQLQYSVKHESKTHLWDQNLISDCHAARDSLAILIQAAGPDGQNPRLVKLLDARLREEDAGRSTGFSLNALDEDAVEQRGEGLDRFECGGLFVFVLELLLPFT
jgi:hypothetical protein